MSRWDKVYLLFMNPLTLISTASQSRLPCPKNRFSFLESVTQRIRVALF